MVKKEVVKIILSKVKMVLIIRITLIKQSSILIRIGIQYRRQPHAPHLPVKRKITSRCVVITIILLLRVIFKATIVSPIPLMTAACRRLAEQANVTRSNWSLNRVTQGAPVGIYSLICTDGCTGRRFSYPLNVTSHLSRHWQWWLHF